MVSDFKKYCQENNIVVEIIKTSQTTNTAQEAADFHNVDVAAIVKSLVVKDGQTFHVFLVPGNQRINFDFLKQEFKLSNPKMATPDEVKQVTGYSIGGVPPFGHKTKLKIHIYPGFDPYNKLIAAAGSHLATFDTNLTQLMGVISSQD